MSIDHEVKVLTFHPSLFEMQSVGLVFSALHSLLVALIPKYFSADQWSMSLQPVSDAEKLMATMQAPSLTARKGTTLFERDARSLSRDICKNLLSYCQIRTDNANRTGTVTFQKIDGLDEDLHRAISIFLRTTTS